MFLRTVLIAIVCFAWMPAAIRAGEAVGQGDFEFFLDSAAFRMPDGSTRQDIYLRVPNAGIRFKDVGGKYEASPRLTILIRDSKGNTVVKESGDLKMYAAREDHGADPLRFHTLTKSYCLGEGVYSLSCAIEDRNAAKVTVLGMMQNKYKESVISGYPLEVPTFPEDRLSISDPKFVWNIGRIGDETTYSPNPSRMYGLYRDSLSVFVEAYIPRSIASSQELEIKTSILDEYDSTVTTSSVVIPRAEAHEPGGAMPDLATYPILITEDLNRFTAGRYSLYINAGTTEQLLIRRRAGTFSVAWDMRTWEVTRRNLVAEARFLLDGKNFKGFTSKTIGEQEALVQNMWKENDPDPSTGVNEAYETFLERLAYIDAKYNDSQPAIFSDRGLVYLKFGAPDEKIVDVMPLNRESVSDALQKVEDRYHPVNFSNTGGRLGYAKTHKNIIIDPRRLGAVGEGGETASPFELWIYNQSGEPIRKRDRNLEQDHGLRFIFIDREGYGRYRLESSSSMAQ